MVLSLSKYCKELYMLSWILCDDLNIEVIFSIKLSLVKVILTRIIAFSPTFFCHPLHHSEDTDRIKHYIVTVTFHGHPRSKVMMPIER